MEPNKDNNRKKKKLIILISLLIIVTTGMIVAITLITSKSTEPEIDSRSFEEMFWNSETAEDAIEEFQKKIDSTTDREQKAKLYIERSKFLFEIFGPQDQYTDQILSDIIHQDEILQTADSAYLAYDRYSFYNISDLALKYEDLYYERSGGER